MGVENTVGLYIDGLNTGWPDGATEDLREGDDHIRLIKTALKNSFPNVDAPIDGTPSQLNAVASAAGAGLLATTTVIAFWMSAVPSGWTKATANLDATNGNMVRVVTGTGGGYYTGHSPILNDKVPQHQHSDNFATSSAGEHNHRVKHCDSGGDNCLVRGTSDSNGAYFDLGYIENDGAHTHTITGSVGNVSGSADNWEPSYIDMILGHPTP